MTYDNVMLSIISTLRIVNLGDMIVKINTIRATILTITTTTTIIAVSHREENIIFVVKKVVTLANIQMMSNGRQKNFEDETENSAEIKANTTLFWPIMKEI